MNTEKENKEHFNFQLGKLKMDSNQPGKETRKTLAVLGAIAILLLIIALVGCYFLKTNLLTAGLFGTGTALVSSWVGKGNRSP